MAFQFLSVWIPSTTTGCLSPFSVWGMSSYWAFLPHLQKYSEVLGMLGQLPFPSASPCRLDSFSPFTVGVSQPHEMCLSDLNTGVANAGHRMSSCEASAEFLSIFLCSGIVFHGASETGFDVFGEGVFQGCSPEQPVSSGAEEGCEHDWAPAWRRCEGCLLVTTDNSRYIPYLYSLSSVFLPQVLSTDFDI